jgi:mannose-6-phosphate isomerase
VYAGLKPGVTPREFERAVADQTVESLLQRIPVRAGVAVYIPGGRVHAIGAGCLLLECQQNSNTTYRIYDFGRRTSDGKMRELHSEQAARVIRWNDSGPPLVEPRLVGPPGRNQRWEILTAPYFFMEQRRWSEPGNLAGDAQTFRVLFVEQGGLRLTGFWGDELAEAGTTLLLPAACPEMRVAPVTGEARFLLMGLPPPAVVEGPPPASPKGR